MRTIRTAILAGIAGLAVAGTALAASNDAHILRVALPDGSVARIAYRGDVPPQLRVVPARSVAPFAWPDAFAPIAFAPLDRMMAEMDMQAAAMMRQVAAMQTAPVTATGGPGVAALASMPAGTMHYSMVSFSNGSATCTRSVEVTSAGAGAKPKLISSSTGDCGSSTASTPAVAPTATGLNRPPHEAPAVRTTI